MFNVLLKGGTVIDGLGGPSKRMDVGIQGGRITALGCIEGTTNRSIDISGLAVAPGFVDIHTHYDAQILWDPAATPSCLHGVTTAIGGNCGFTIAPMRPNHVDYIARMLAMVEGMPLATLQAGLDWNWQSFGDWLGRIEGRSAMNMGFLVGHSTLRRVIMGDDAVGRSATAQQIDQMADLLHQCLNDGALGISSSLADAHRDGDGNTVPSCHAELEELFTLARVTGEHSGTVMEIALGTPGIFGNREVDAAIRMSQLANRSINWNNLRIQTDDSTFADMLLEYGTRASKQNAEVIVLTYPDASYQLVSLNNPRLWSSMPGWDAVMKLPLVERKERLKDTNVRRQLRDYGHSVRQSRSPIIASISNWETLTFAQMALPKNEALRGRTVGDVAREREQDSLDTLLDIAIEEDLNTYFEMCFEADMNDKVWQQRARVWRDPRVILGASDAGAHMDQICGFRYTTALLGQSVRRRQLLELEQAVRLLTDVPARYYGLRGRGRIALGWYADLVVFDPERIDYLPTEIRHDLPGGASRLYCGSKGIEHVFVNGIEVVRAGAHTGNLPGTILRSARDLDTRLIRH